MKVKPSMPGISTSTRNSAYVLLAGAFERLLGRDRDIDLIAGRFQDALLEHPRGQANRRSPGPAPRAPRSSTAAPASRSASPTRPSASRTSCGLPSASSDAPATIGVGRREFGKRAQHDVRRAEQPVDADRSKPGAAAHDDRRHVAARARRGAGAQHSRERDERYDLVVEDDRIRPCELRDMSRGARRCVWRTASSGIVADIPALSTTSASTAASDSGTISSKVVPRPAVVRTATSPPSRSSASRTMSMPMPRPETSVTAAEVLRPPRRSSRTRPPASSLSISAAGSPLRRAAAAHRLKVDAAAVVLAAEDDAPAAPSRPEATTRPAAGLPAAVRVGGVFDAVRDGVADDLHQRFLHGAEHVRVEADVAALRLERHALPRACAASRAARSSDVKSVPAGTRRSCSATSRTW